MQEITAIVVDDIDLMRVGLVSQLSPFEQTGIKVLGVAANGEEAIALASETRPDVVLMDLQMPVMDGPTATRKILTQLPQTRILAITTFASQDYIAAAFAAGVCGYILKDAAQDKILDAVRSACNGNSVMTDEIRQTITQQYQVPATTEQRTWEGLTSAETKVAQYLVKGYSNKEIADELYVAETTVKTHVSSIMRKTGCVSRTRLIAHLFNM